MIDGHIISVESKRNISNNATFLIQMHILVTGMY